MRLPRIVCLFTVLSVASCGGSGGGTGITTLEIASTGVIDGFVRTDNLVFTAGSGPDTGDLDCLTPNLGCRMFFHYDLSGIPAGATIVSATFKPYQVVAVGNPFVSLGAVVVDHVDFGASLDAGDFNAPPLLPSFAVVSDSATVGHRFVDVTARVVADRAAARSYSEFRLRHASTDSNGDTVCDFVQWEDGEASWGSGGLPLLQVRYQS